MSEDLFEDCLFFIAPSDSNGTDKIDPPVYISADYCLVYSHFELLDNQLYGPSYRVFSMYPQKPNGAKDITEEVRKEIKENNAEHD